MLILIGGRSAVPALSGALQFVNEIDRIKFLICDSERYLQFQKNVATVLLQENSNIKCDPTDINSVDPSNFDEVYIATQSLLSCGGDLLYVNLTTVPQTMSIAVYSYVLRNHKDVLVFSVNTNIAKIIPLVFGKRQIDFNRSLTVENYVFMFGFSTFRKKTNSITRTLINASKYLMRNLNLYNKVITLIRQGDNIKTPKTLSIKRSKIDEKQILYSDLICFFEKLKNFNLISNFTEENSSLKYRIEKKKDYSFLNGEWLEVFVYSEAQKCGFDSVEFGVELDNYRGEIDVFCLHRANAMICECKTGKYSSSDIDEFSAKAEKLGGSYCIKLFIVGELDVDDKEKEKILNKAKNNSVVLVFGKELYGIQDILQSEMKHPTYPRR